MKERVKTMTGINEVAKEIHENAVAHGWWDIDAEEVFGRADE